MAKLVCVSGMNKGDEFPLHEGKNVVGRGSENKVVLFDKKCSREHCIIHKKGRHYSVQDLDSSNGTLLGGKRVPRNKYISLEPGDWIKIGETKMHLSERCVGNVIEQTATDAAADLQGKKYDKLIREASQKLKKPNLKSSKEKGIRAWLSKLLKKNR